MKSSKFYKIHSELEPAPITRKLNYSQNLLHFSNMESSKYWENRPIATITSSDNTVSAQAVHRGSSGSL